MAKAKTPVCIHWLDSGVQPGWRMATQNDNAPVRCQSIGWIVKEDRRAITLAASVSEFGQATDAITIPRGCIKKIGRVKNGPFWNVTEDS